MKILFIVTQSEFGGAQRFVFDAAKYFAEQGNEVIVAAGEGDGEISSKFKVQSSKLKVKIQNLRQLKRVPDIFNSFLAIKEIINLLKQERPEVLFLCSTTAGILGSVAAYFYKKKFQVPSSCPERSRRVEFRVIYRIGGWAFRDPRPWWQNKIILWLEKLTARFKDKIIVNSEIDRELALKYKICPPQKIVKIYNGVDVEQLQFLPKNEAMAVLNEKLKIKNYRIIGCVANFYKTKGLRYLIEAVRLLCFPPHLRTGKFPSYASPAGEASAGRPACSASHSDAGRQVTNYRAIIIGDGRGRKELEKLIKKYGLQETIFLVGKIPDAYKYLKAFDVFVLPSLKEGFPWIILEAMAAQTAIVATSVGAVPEIIENKKQGLLAPPKNSQALAEKIAWLLEHPTEAQEMAASAREKVEKQFTREKMLSQTAEIILRR